MNKSRQVGFSWLVAGEAVWKALTKPNQLILIVSSAERAARNIIKYIHDWLDSFQAPFGGIRSELVEDSVLAVSFRNGSKIMSLPCSPKTIRGYPADHIYLDEFAFFEMEDKVWEAILPSISFTHGTVTITSTPFGKLNNYYKFYVEDYAEVWSKHLVHHSECPQLDVTSIKSTMDEIQFRQEYCNQFVDEAVSFFSYDLIKSCVNPNLRNERYGSPIYAGIDFGKKIDSTVLTLIERGDGRACKVIFIREWVGVDYKVQLGEIAEILHDYGVVQMYVDETGVGTRLIEDCREMEILTEGVVFSVGVKEKMICDLKVLFQDGVIEIPDNKKLIRQLHTIERLVPKGAIHVQYRHRKGKHDDYVWALALAVLPVCAPQISWYYKIQ